MRGLGDWPVQICVYISNCMGLISEEEKETDIDDFFSEVTRRKQVKVIHEWNSCLLMTYNDIVCQFFFF